MSAPLKITFVTAVNSRDVLEKNLLASPCLQSKRDHQIIIQEGFTAAASAYNDALNRCLNDVVAFVHQDVFLPESWMVQLNRSLDFLATNDPNWGVLGCWGHVQSGAGFGHVYTNGQGVAGQAFDQPIRVQTLDEIVLVIRKSSRLRFDDSLPDFHFYGTDICMAAASKGRACYALSAFCIHNCRSYKSYPEEFYCGYRHIKRTWKSFLPIQTSCIRISRFDENYYKLKLRQAYRKVLGRTQQRGDRTPDPRLILDELRTGHELSRFQTERVLSSQPL